jgi:hypothetical protein
MSNFVADHPFTSAAILVLGGLALWSTAEHRRPAAESTSLPQLPTVTCETLTDASESCAIRLAKGVGAVIGAASTCDDLTPRLRPLRERARDWVARAAVDYDDQIEATERLENHEILWRNRYRAGQEPEDCQQIGGSLAVVERKVSPQ